tara:strand:+ start:3191 stop:3460 length:270 start_codon:yes stop_codon:yes gene_type:complete
MDFPFSEMRIGKKLFLREFKKETSQDELIWHLDKEDRKVELVEGRNWKLQLDNELPKTLIIGESYWIPKMTYHRLICGDGDLVIKVWKY